MGKTHDLVYNVMNYGKPTPLELKNLIISILVIAFVISFKDWGVGDEVDVLMGLTNFLIAIVIVTVSFFVHHLAHRAAALSVGYKPEYKLWTWGLLLALTIAIISRGNVWFIIPGGIMVHHLAGFRLGFFRYDLNYFGTGLLSALGAVATMIFALFLKIIYLIIPSPIIHKALIFNILFAVYMILPIPPADGSRMFFGSRMVYVFIFSAIVAAAVLLYIDIPIWLAAIGTFIIAAISWVLYYVLIEMKLWKGPYAK